MTSPVLAYHVLLADGTRLTLCEKHFELASDVDEAILVAVSQPFEGCDVCDGAEETP